MLALVPGRFQEDVIGEQPVCSNNDIGWSEFESLSCSWQARRNRRFVVFFEQRVLALEVVSWKRHRRLRAPRARCTLILFPRPSSQIKQLRELEFFSQPNSVLFNVYKKKTNPSFYRGALSSVWVMRYCLVSQESYLLHNGQNGPLTCSAITVVRRN
jgi:hypothetical protein